MSTPASPLSNPPDRCTPELCAAVSLRAGEDPIGTASGAPLTLLIEHPLPWPRDPLTHTTRFPGLPSALAEAVRAGLRVRALAVTPREDTPRGMTRVLAFRQPTGEWATLHKQEFLVPDAQVTALTEALLHGTSAAPAGAHELDGAHVRELLVCTHGNVDAACGKLGYALYRELERVPTQQPARAWRVSHVGGHRFAPTLLDLPTGRMWAHLDPLALARLLRQVGPVTDLHRHQRGWIGADAWGQMAERAVFERVGWTWLAHTRHTETLRVEDGSGDPLTTPTPPRSALVRVHHTTPDGARGAFDVTIEPEGFVLTVTNTGKDATRANRYRVTSVRTC